MGIEKVTIDKVTISKLSSILFLRIALSFRYIRVFCVAIQVKYESNVTAII